MRRARNLPQIDPIAQANIAAGLLVKSLEVDHFDVAIVFGTGWDAAVDELGSAQGEVRAINYPGFVAPTVEGHAGMIRSVRIGQQQVLVFRGRKHRYEFATDDTDCLNAVVHGVRVAHACKCKTVILTNAVGGLKPGLSVGEPVLIADFNAEVTHAPTPFYGPQFLDCIPIFDPGLREHCHELDNRLTEGVYAQVRGPRFETVAEAYYLRNNGVDLVGMSIIQEALMARLLGMKVLGLSLVTDVFGEAVSHTKVQAVVKARAPELGQFLRQLIEQL